MPCFSSKILIIRGSLKEIAKRFKLPIEEMKCYGCRSDKRGQYCKACKMYACAVEKGINFCSECDEYPCSDIKQFQSERPHRIELWDSLSRIKEVGYKSWLKENRENYKCPECKVINSAYDLKCRKCGEEPSCGYVLKHKDAIVEVLKNL
ncbi:MAG: DUF3795 domain-containing protein [Desulfobacterales bacterium]|nr:DUF3795 domain-containing protein [Desulfobacterales bacterium]MCP4159209.1 DUF3795 domain-containing protein [Deltaproteobacteria bacterium]